MRSGILLGEPQRACKKRLTLQFAEDLKLLTSVRSQTPRRKPSPFSEGRTLQAGGKGAAHSEHELPKLHHWIPSFACPPGLTVQCRQVGLPAGRKENPNLSYLKDFISPIGWAVKAPIFRKNLLNKYGFLVNQVSLSAYA
jgi:hypothetical protein